MFCDACGTPLQPGQSFCPRCGKAITGGVPAIPGRVARHAHILGVLWIIYSVLHAFGGVALLILANTIFLHMGRFLPPDVPPPARDMPAFLHPMFMFLGWLLLAKGLAGIAAGIGLLQRLPWARTLTIIVAIISLINIPLGTALGIYSLWALLSPNADEEYRQMSQASGA